MGAGVISAIACRRPVIDGADRLNDTWMCGSGGVGREIHGLKDHIWRLPHQVLAAIAGNHLTGDAVRLDQIA